MAGYQARLIEAEDLWRAVPCRQACPVHTDAGRYVSLIREGRFDEARVVAAEGNPLVHVCAWVCVHGCEGACSRARVDAPLSICALKRFAVEYGRSTVARAPLAEREERVAIVGAGPAGLSAARDLRLMGYRVTVYERAPSPGGMPYLSIPRHRLPRDVIRRDVEAIQALGVEMHCGRSLGREFTLHDLEREGYRAVLLALGTTRGRGLGLEGFNYQGALHGLEFLLAYNLGQPVRLGKKVVVVGGGHVAVDVARTALRAGGAREGRPEVHLVCLESRAEMPASPEEVAAAEAEGVVIHPRRGPGRILGRDGRVAGLELRLVKSAYGSDGRLRPVFYPGYRETLEADSVLLAVGQEPDLSWLQPGDGVEVTAEGLVAVDGNLATSRPGVFAAGDLVTGTRSVIAAVAEGRKAARSIHRHLRGWSRENGGIAPRSRPRLFRAGHYRGTDDYLRLPRQPEPGVNLGYDRERAHREAGRCLRCEVMPWLDPARCILCGACGEICPYDSLKIASSRRVLVTGLPGASPGERRKGSLVLLWNGTTCVRCGLCAARCPTEALSMVRVEWGEV